MESGNRNYDFPKSSIRLPMTKCEFFVQSTIYQYSKLIRGPTGVVSEMMEVAGGFVAQ